MPPGANEAAADKPVSSDPDVEETRTAAEQGDAEAQVNLGTMYSLGQGVRQDYAKAKEWYEKAALQGNEEAQFSLGVLYEEGAGVRQNKATAKEWFGKACDNGNQKGCDAYAGRL